MAFCNKGINNCPEKKNICCFACNKAIIYSKGVCNNTCVKLWHKNSKIEDAEECDDFRLTEGSINREE